ncbi:MAG TPA: aconitate hydratase [Candidatus Bathyarchaeia archaeon]
MKNLSKTMSERIIQVHCVEGRVEAGQEIAITIDQTLTQDATGTLVYMLFEAMGIPKTKTKLSVSYIDHNILQTGPNNADDHHYLQTAAAKYGVILSKAGNGICHSLHLERFARPGWTLLGSDSHTPTAGAMGMIAIGSGGLDVATVMSGEPYYMRMPEILGIKLHGDKPPWVSAKDIILSVIGTIGVNGGLDKILEYSGDGTDKLAVPERATIANMGAETGATTSIFPSDEETLRFLKSYGRENEWTEIKPSLGNAYSNVVEVDVSSLEPLAAKPHSPGNVVGVKEIEGVQVDQVCIGGCTNSSYSDIVRVAAILKGKHVNSNVSLTVSPGSRVILKTIAENGVLSDLISAGARILECACGPCIGMGQAPPSGGVSLRTFNRNFEGRSGTTNAEVYLVSPEVAAVAALYGAITDPRKHGEPPSILPPPKKFKTDDSLLVKPSSKPESVTVIRGLNIKPPPPFPPMPSLLEGTVLIKLGDNISTDHIMPAGASILPLRSNIPEISKYVFSRIDANFANNAVAKGGGFVVGGESYGQGSSREHAALCPRYLGVKSVIVKSFARIHRDNLINFGILPLAFASKKDYDRLSLDDKLRIQSVSNVLAGGGNMFTVENLTKRFTFDTSCDLTERQRKILLEGGLFNYIKKKNA